MLVILMVLKFVSFLIISSRLVSIRVTTHSEEQSSVALLSPAVLICLLLLGGNKGNQ